MQEISSLLELIHTIQPLSETERESLVKTIKIQHYKKHTYLLQAGQVSDTVFFVLKGLVRAYHHDINLKVETTAWFINEGGFIYSVSSFVNQKPSFESIVAEEDSTVIALNKADLYSLVEKSSAFGKIALVLTEQYIAIYD